MIFVIRAASPFAHDGFLSKNSFASLIFVAKYGLPPRSGWFSNISCRCFFRIISFVMPRSLQERICQPG